jgi:hypothetical protein
MPGKRDPSQTIMTVSLSNRLLGILDSARVKKARGVNRAQFVREALAEYLAKLGFPVPEDDLMPPDRVKPKTSDVHVLNCNVAANLPAPRKRAKKKP